MTVALSEELIFNCGRKILLSEGKISFTVSAEGLEIKFPTTRKISAELNVPHYYVMPYFAGLEENGFLTRTERVGILTTQKGSKMLFAGMSDDEKARTEKILGKKITEAVLTFLQ